ncbi:hypothetical protein LOTGIDRAFT_230583 [Lottia gigantea]|uniref:Ig-like domain-containing protein n=1 Tax=Lottia gigantea TaxID=225164 RepID=V4B8Q4_LOTGI|nr:hypothetical protein LOTGIDRAFT_230583 [Lottia gigantea]ESP02197.1 hypothetical protein LOTGIDRAFT_230583 [Lottia gigantea]
MKKLALALLLVGISLTESAVENPDWETTPEWSFQVYLNEDAHLKCNDSDVMLMLNDEVHWKLPDDTEVHGWSDRNTTKHELMDLNGVKGATLRIKNVQHSDSGLYFCSISRGGVFLKRVNRGLNLHGYLVHDQFDLYQTNLVTAVVAAVVFCVPLLFLCFLYRYQYRTPQQKQRRKEKEAYFTDLQKAIQNDEAFPTKPSRNGYENQAYIDTHL